MNVTGKILETDLVILTVKSLDSKYIIGLTNVIFVIKNNMLKKYLIRFRIKQGY